MKKFFIIAILLVIGLARPAHATNYPLVGDNYKILLSTTDRGTFVTVTPKGSSTLPMNVIVSDKKYTGSGPVPIPLFIGSASVSGTKIFWIGGMNPSTTYYFYPFGDAKTILQFSTDAIDQTSGKYTIASQSFSNGTLTFTYTAPPTEKRPLFITALPRSALATFLTNINTNDYPHVSVGVTAASGIGQSSIGGLEAGQEYVLVMQADGTGASEIITARRVQTGDVTQVYANDLVFTAAKSVMNVKGQIDTSKTPFPEDFCAKLEYIDASAGSFMNGQNPQGALFYNSQKTAENLNIVGINHDGTYYWRLLNMTTGHNYAFRETFYRGPCGGTVIGTPVIGKFNADKGLIPPGGTLEQNDFEKRSYRLLAPFPGLSVLLDPDLCQERQADGRSGEICNINDFLNYAFRIMIGLSAIILVVRIMIEGFQYATTDVLALKISSKQKLWQGVWGLLLALSAWIILNTINPKLVENDITIQGVNILIEPGDDGLGIQPTADKTLSLKTKSGQAVTVTACNDADMATVTAFGTTFKIQKQLVPSIQRIDEKWRLLNPAYKIPMTVQDKAAMGGYVCRNIAGRKILSYHAYGLAVDINPQENPQGKTLKTDMPAAFVKLWKDEGWGWGGDWTSSKDAMHFSKGSNEGGNMLLD